MPEPLFTCHLPSNGPLTLRGITIGRYNIRTYKLLNSVHSGYYEAAFDSRLANGEVQWPRNVGRSNVFEWYLGWEN